jgi:hypothetical protein
MEPINYMLDVANPMQMALGGYESALGQAQTRQQMGLANTQEARAAEAFALEKRAMEEQRAAAAAERQAAMEARQRGDSAMMRLIELGPNATSKDYLIAINENPAYKESLSTVFDTFSEERKAGEIQSGLQLWAAVKSNPDVAASLISERKRAAEAAGDQETLDTMKVFEAQLAAPGGSDLLTATLGSSLAGLMGADDFKKAAEAIGVGSGDVVDGASPIGKIAQDVNAGLIPQSVLDAQIRVEERAGEEGLTLQQRISEEARLRGEYAKRTEDLSAAERNFSIIEKSSMDQSGAGDIALVTSFMKMLDPGSVVRETEFATAANAGGLLAKLNSIAKQVETGQFLSEQQRADFTRLASEYLNAAKVQEQSVQQSYQQIVENYGLDPVNVFGARAVTDLSPGQSETGALPQSFLTNPNVTNAATAAGVTPEDMWNVMTPEQRARYGG